MRLGIIDIGSNSIKLLVADKGDPLSVVHQTTRETRISHGIGRNNPTLSSESIERGVEAVQSLLDEAHHYQAKDIQIVATSAVRDAFNRDDFADKIHLSTGHTLRVLSGDEEAAYIAKGIATDPALSHFQEFCLADLGGGSLELIHLRNHDVIRKISLPLGAVRLTEQYIATPSLPIPDTEVARIAKAVRETIHASDFHLPSGRGLLAGTGGALTVARAIRAGWLGRHFNDVGNKITVTYLRYLLSELTEMSQEDRTRVPNLNSARADILPAALTTLITVAEMADAAAFIHSLHNLRHGIAAELLSQSR